MNMAMTHKFMVETLDNLIKQHEAKIFLQLNELVSRGLLIVDKGPLMIVYGQHTNTVELKQSVQLTLKDKEYIEKLENENKELKESLEFIKNMLRSKDLV